MPEPEVMTTEEINALKGEVKPGRTGFVPLDDTGKPSGPATALAPEDGLAAPVLIQAEHKADEVTTPSGAPITSVMNPAHSYMDAGLAERNPPGPPLTEEQLAALEYKGGGVQLYSDSAPPASPPPL